MYGLTLRSIDVTGNVIDMFGSIKVTVVYYNEYPSNLESTYKFCLDPNAVIDSFIVTLKDKKLTGTVKEKKEARNEYTNAVKNNKKTSLLEKKDDIYSLYVGNIESNETIVITYTYLTRLSENDNKYVFVYPTNLGHRYGMTGNLSREDIESKKFNGSKMLENIDLTYKPTNFFFNISFLTNGKIKSLTSETNEIHITKVTDNEFNTSLTSESSLGDLNILVETEEISTLYLDYDTNKTDSTDNLSYFMLNHKIINEEVQIIPKNIYFFLDRSGSMNGLSMTNAINALISAINKLNNISYFNIISFGSDFYPMFSKSVIASNENKIKATNMLKTYSANMGGTEIFNCLKYCTENNTHNDIIKFDFYVDEVSNDFDNSMEKIFFFLTDGQVENQELVMNLLSNTSNIRIFSIGIGSSVSRELIYDMANLTKGISRLAIDNNTIENVIKELFENIYKKYYVNISLMIDGNVQNFVGDKCIYPGTTNNYLFMLENEKVNGINEIVLTGFYGTEQKYWKLNLESKINLDKSVIRKIILNELIKKKEISLDLILHYSKTYNIMNEYTSFIMVDDTELNKHIDNNYDQIDALDLNWRNDERDEEIEHLEGGMDMYSGGSKSITIQTYNTNIDWSNINKLLNATNYSYKFNTDSWKLLCYLTQVDFDLHAKQSTLTRVLLFNMIILIKLIEINKNSVNANNLLNYFNLKYPNLYNEKSSVVKNLYDDYINKLKSFKTTKWIDNGDY